MGIRPKRAHEIDKVECVVFHVELAGTDRNIAGIVPVGHEDIAIRQQAHHGRTQQRGVMARHRRDKQHAAGHRFPAAHEELDQVAERLVDDGLDVNKVILAFRPDDGPDAPVRLGDHARERALCHLAPGGSQRQHGVHRQGKGGVGCHGSGGCAHPLVGVAHSFHQIVGGHKSHVVSCPEVPGNNSSLSPPVGRRYVASQHDIGETFL